jgi:meso-butanediol dehydrogenase/(S,S)-butanediol dehydrogenase/diacetyl reductase
VTGVAAGRRFADRVCIVTGGGRGIGADIARALAGEGAHVGIVARTREQCEAIAEELGDSATAIPGDVLDASACANAVEAMLTSRGRPSVLVNAAGISPVRARAEAHDLAAFRRILDVNVAGAFTMTQAVAPALLAGGGAVVNVASVLATIASPRLAGYGASKAALVQLTRTLAREWADRGVRVNAVCPGYVETEMTAAMLAVDRLRDEIVAATPLGRLAAAAEVVAPVLFLASDDASYITGAAVPVDGGMTA